MYVKDGVEYPTYGAYLRGKNLSVDTAKTGRDQWDAEITAYKDARRQGVQPAGTRMPQIKEAMELSQKVGRAYDAGTGTFK